MELGRVVGVGVGVIRVQGVGVAVAGGEVVVEVVALLLKLAFVRTGESACS